MSVKTDSLNETYVLTGKGYRRGLIPWDLFSLVGVFAIAKFTVFNFPPETIAENPFFYWGGLLGVTFCAYMATFRISLRRVAAARHGVAVAGKFFEGTKDELYEFVLSLQDKGTAVMNREIQSPSKLYFSYSIDDNGNEVIAVKE